VFKQQRDGFLFNQFDGTLLNDQNRFGVRGQLLWTPSDELVIRVIGEYGELDQRCCAIALFGPVSPTIQASDDYMGYQRPGTNPADRITDNNIQPLSKLTKESAAVVRNGGHLDGTSLSVLLALIACPTTPPATTTAPP